MLRFDQKPAQIACMSKSSVLRLLRLLTQGSILKRESQVEFGISYWVWSLLAKLPDRGELNSEEIGVVRELGKKAVLIGMGLKEVKDWQQGMQNVEAEFEENLGAEENAGGDDDEIYPESEDDFHEEGYPDSVINVKQAMTDIQSNGATSEALPANFDILDTNGNMDQPVSASSQTFVADSDQIVAAENIEELSEGEVQSTEGDVEDPEALAAMKAQMLNRLKSPDEVNIEEEVSTTPKPRPPPSRSNTKATVDMIITIAGEIYGQRDLLEFRSEWAHIM